MSVVEEHNDDTSNVSNNTKTRKDQYKRPLDAWKFKKSIKPVLVKDWEVTPSPVVDTPNSSSNKKSSSNRSVRAIRHVRPPTDVSDSAKESDAQTDPEQQALRNKSKRETSPRSKRISTTQTTLPVVPLAAASPRRSPRKPSSPRVSATTSFTKSNDSLNRRNSSAAAQKKQSVSSITEEKRRSSPRISKPTINQSTKNISDQSVSNVSHVQSTLHDFSVVRGADMSAMSRSSKRMLETTGRQSSPNKSVKRHSVMEKDDGRPKEKRAKITEESMASERDVTARRNVTLSQETIANLEKRRQNVTANFFKLSQSHVTMDRSRDPETVKKGREFLRQKKALRESRVEQQTSSTSQDEVGSPRTSRMSSDEPVTMNDVSLIRVSDFTRRKQMGQITDLDVAHSLLMNMAKQFEIEEDEFPHFKTFVKTVEKELAQSVGASIELRRVKTDLARSRKTVNDLGKTLMSLYSQKQKLKTEYEEAKLEEERENDLTDVSEWARGVGQLFNKYVSDKSDQNASRSKRSFMVQSNTPKVVGDVMRRIEAANQTLSEAH